ncbi:unnamed protein product [Polarella glacialis]|uniref:Protein kinase domain-containing protein n=1 Tax=Polarella glacialis TaxID=89957 RepID=A0A813KQ28_POLGL|nr:unnamed protein product [Polarella glacialis]
MAGTSFAPSAGGGAAGNRGGLDIGELQLTSNKFDPMMPCLQAQLTAQLSAQLGQLDAVSVEEMTGFKGGLNEGVWYLACTRKDVREEYVLKLVRCNRIATNILTESENFAKMFTDHPALVSDPVIAFPVKLFSVCANGAKINDLIVMKKVPGERMAELISRLNHGKQIPQLLQICEKLGVCLADFHGRYSSQHGDFQPSNVFFDEARGAFFLIDIGGMGVPTMDNDVEHFLQAMRIMSGAYGAKLAGEMSRSFEQGYQRAGGRFPP